jgi:hypothetical protein
LDAIAIKSFSKNDVQKYFNIPLDVKELESLVDLIVIAFNTCGERLFELGFTDFASFVTTTLQTEKTAAYLVQQLVSAFPEVYDDSYSYNTGNETIQVLLYKKVQLTVAELYNFHAHKDPLFDLPDIKSMTAYVDNVIPATLVKSGVLVLDSALYEMIQGRVPLPVNSDYEIELRAVALCATELLVKESNHKYDTLKLAYYLWGVLGKQSEYRVFERHATETIMY